jgi:hypothetical protein
MLMAQALFPRGVNYFGPNNVPIDQTESERQYRLIDQNMTAHAVLRDRYRRRSSAFDISLLCLSIGLNAFVFTDEAALKLIFFGHAVEAKLWIGLISVALLVLSLIGLRVDWDGRSRSHKEAVERLGRLKARYREVHASGGDADAREELAKEYARTMELLPAIPERSFTRLKAHHQVKRLLSREVDAHPGVPWWILSLRARCHAIWRLFRGWRSK